MANTIEAQVKPKGNKQSIEQKARAAATKPTDRGSIESKIKEEFQKWMQKGEFEKEADRSERLKNSSKTAFDNICANQILEGILNVWETETYGLKFSDYRREQTERTQDRKWDVKLSAYNSESEMFVATLAVNGFKLDFRVAVPIDQAPIIKEKSKAITKFPYWCFENNKLRPTKVWLRSGGDEELGPSELSNNKKDITLSFDNLGLTNPYLKGHIFGYNAHCKKMESVKYFNLGKDSYEREQKASYGQDYTEAIENFQKSIQLDPDNAVGYNWLGVAYYN
ncbi:hypothetical protein FACS1894195_5010 [Bacteroidia bacterium]|nr:hypothetical protein FACS1894195_5010 [Bacteroidia bacterium]